VNAAVAVYVEAADAPLVVDTAEDGYNSGWYAVVDELVGRLKKEGAVSNEKAC